MLSHKRHSSPCDTHLEYTIKSPKIHGKLGIVRVHMGTKESNQHHTQGDASVSVIAKAIVLAQCLIFVKSYLDLGNSSVFMCRIVLPHPQINMLKSCTSSILECGCIWRQGLFKNFYLFIYFWLCWVFIAAHRLSLVATSGCYTSLQCVGFSLWWLLLLQSTGSRCVGFSSCGLQALACRLSSCGTRAQLLRGMWDLPGPGLQPVSPALAGGFLTTAPPGKPWRQGLYRGNQVKMRSLGWMGPNTI